MAKAKKKANTKKGDRAKVKKKTFKKIGLAKYIQTDSSKSRQPKKVPDVNQKCDIKLKKKNVLSKELGLIDRCKLQMSSSLLRLVDEKIYTSDTSDILDREKFLAYHDAYKSVSKSWPTKPIDFIVKFIKRRLLVKKPVHRLKFADVGCGQEPLLKMKLPQKAKVQSFDIVSIHEDIVEANMEKLPIDACSIDCAVYSLSLMAKNLGTVILEAKRILKLGGSLLIVEVTSRFEGHEERFIGKLHKLGLKKKSMVGLKPNNYFTFFHFTKIDTNLDFPKSCLNIELKPCVYKAR